MGMGMRSRWAAIGAAVAVSLGAGGVGIGMATTSSGDRAIYTAIEPCRAAALLPAPHTVGPRPAPLAADETYTIDGWGTVGDCDLPTGTSALALNVTATTATAPTFLTLFPAGTERPFASHLNPAPGAPPAPNAVNVKLNGSGEFSIYNLNGDTSVIVDVVGVFDHHTHDDRYYKKADVDSKIATAIATQPWSVGLPVSGAQLWSTTWNIASGGSKAPTGALFPETPSTSLWHGFTLPPEYAAGSDVKVNVRWMGEITNLQNCIFVMRASDVSARTGGQEYFGLDAEWEFPLSPGVKHETKITYPGHDGDGTWTDEPIDETFFTIPGADLAPGDDVLFRLLRDHDDINDTCTEGIVVLGMSATAG